jgi:hypothetical protein
VEFAVHFFAGSSSRLLRAAHALRRSSTKTIKALRQPVPGLSDQRGGNWHIPNRNSSVDAGTQPSPRCCSNYARCPRLPIHKSGSPHLHRPGSASIATLAESKPKTPYGAAMPRRCGRLRKHFILDRLRTCLGKPSEAWATAKQARGKSLLNLLPPYQGMAFASRLQAWTRAS